MTRKFMKLHLSNIVVSGFFVKIYPGKTRYNPNSPKISENSVFSYMWPCYTSFFMKSNGRVVYFPKFPKIFCTMVVTILVAVNEGEGDTQNLDVRCRNLYAWGCSYHGGSKVLERVEAIPQKQIPVGMSLTF